MSSDLIMIKVEILNKDWVIQAAPAQSCQSVVLETIDSSLQFRPTNNHSTKTLQALALDNEAAIRIILLNTTSLN